jgi:NTP pyrophosphatase (non-canonical NTP hydrolase)
MSLFFIFGRYPRLGCSGLSALIFKRRNQMVDLNQQFRDYLFFIRSLQQQRENQKNKFRSDDYETDQLSFLMHHGIIGVVTESGELMDLVKKHLVYDRDFDKKKVADEAGDCLFYLMMIIDACGLTIGDIINLNVAKLKARYPDGFTPDKANNRNLEAEKNAQNGIFGPIDGLDIGGY